MNVHFQQGGSVEERQSANSEVEVLRATRVITSGSNDFIVFKSERTGIKRL